MKTPNTNSNMELLKSLGRNIKNIFVGSHRGEDFVLENLEKFDKKETAETQNPKNNDLGVDPDEWFAPPAPEPAWDTKNTEKSDKKEEKEEEITMHEKMYRMATARYNPFAIGGSENCDSDVSCTNLGGGSERIQK
tara:strand:+ start:329 stop:736 length:408 start_codon:yes stop_codon:yes gene_type:complete